MEAPAQGKTARVLVVGDVADLAQLQTKEAAVMKQQSFDAVFCVGGFQQGAVKVRYHLRTVAPVSLPGLHSQHRSLHIGCSAGR